MSGFLWLGTASFGPLLVFALSFLDCLSHVDYCCNEESCFFFSGFFLFLDNSFLTSSIIITLIVLELIVPSACIASVTLSAFSVILRLFSA